MLLITCHAGDDRYAVALRHVREVVPRALLQRPSGLPSWLAGLLIFRGEATPVIDLAQLTQGRPCANRLSSRILILRTEWDGRERHFGLLAENVGISESPEDAAAPGCAGELAPLGRLRLDAQGVFQLLDPELLVDDSRRAVLFAEEKA